MVAAASPKIPSHPTQRQAVTLSRPSRLLVAASSHWLAISPKPIVKRHATSAALWLHVLEAPVATPAV